MSVVEKIIESVNALSPAAQEHALQMIERLRRRDDQVKDEQPIDDRTKKIDLERWSVDASRNAFADLPANEWDAVYKEWIARHPEKDEAR